MTDALWTLSEQEEGFQLTESSALGLCKPVACLCASHQDFLCSECDPELAADLLQQMDRESGPKMFLNTRKIHGTISASE